MASRRNVKAKRPVHGGPCAGRRTHEDAVKSRAPAQNHCAGAGGGKICGLSCHITVSPEAAADRKALLRVKVTLFYGFVKIFLIIKIWKEYVMLRGRLQQDQAGWCGEI